MEEKKREKETDLVLDMPLCVYISIYYGSSQDRPVGYGISVMIDL